MTRGVRPPVRRATRAAAAGASVALAWVFAGPGGCARPGGGLGQSCLTDEDCLSGYCAQQLCVAAPTYLDGEPPLEEGGADGPLESSAVDGSSPGIPDASSDAARPDASGDVTASAVDGSSSDGTTPDAASDAPEGG